VVKRYAGGRAAYVVVQGRLLLARRVPSHVLLSEKRDQLSGKHWKTQPDIVENTHSHTERGLT